MHKRLILSKIFIGATLRIVFLWGVAGTITVVPNVPEKGNAVTLNIVSTGTVNWIRNGVTLSSCLISGGFCAPSSSGNMAFSANSLASSSTMSITGADQGLNGGDYEVAGERKTLTINSPISSVDLIEQNIKDTVATLVAKIRCVFPRADLQVTIYKIVENGGNSSEVLSNNLVEADNSSCASHESAFNVTKTYRPGHADETFRVKVCGKHLSLNMETCSSLSSLITFKGQPTTLSTPSISFNSTSINSPTADVPPGPEFSITYIIKITASTAASIAALVIVLIIIIKCCLRRDQKHKEQINTKANHSTSVTSF